MDIDHDALIELKQQQRYFAGVNPDICNSFAEAVHYHNGFLYVFFNEVGVRHETQLAFLSNLRIIFPFPH